MFAFQVLPTDTQTSILLRLLHSLDVLLLFCSTSKNLRHTTMEALGKLTCVNLSDSNPKLAHLVLALRERCSTPSSLHTIDVHNTTVMKMPAYLQKDLSNLLQISPHLRELRISKNGFSNMESQGFVRAISSLKELECLDLSYCSMANKAQWAALEHMVANLPKLQVSLSKKCWCSAACLSCSFVLSACCLRVV